jgi:hypothetical protein
MNIPLCPRNGKPGKTVPRQTLQSLTRIDLYDLTALDYWFCDATDCAIVYFDAQGATITLDQLRVPVWQKQPDEPTVPVCYCRKLTSAMIHDEVRQTGHSSAAELVTAIIQAKRCACDLTNPQGTCCLRNVRLVVREAIKQSTQSRS